MFRVYGVGQKLVLACVMTLKEPYKLSAYEQHSVRQNMIQFGLYNSTRWQPWVINLLSSWTDLAKITAAYVVFSRACSRLASSRLIILYTSEKTNETKGTAEYFVRLSEPFTSSRLLYTVLTTFLKGRDYLPKVQLRPPLNHHFSLEAFSAQNHANLRTLTNPHLIINSYISQTEPKSFIRSLQSTYLISAFHIQQHEQPFQTRSLLLAYEAIPQTQVTARFSSYWIC